MMITIITYILLIVGVVLSILWYLNLIKNIPKEGFSSDRNKHSLYDCQGTKQAWCADDCYNISNNGGTCKVRCPGVKPKGAGWLDCKSNPFTKLSSGCHKDWSIINYNSINTQGDECLTAKRNFKQEHYKNMCDGVFIFNDEEKGVSEKITLNPPMGMAREMLIIGGRKKLDECYEKNKDAKSNRINITKCEDERNAFLSQKSTDILFWDPNQEFQNTWSKEPIKGVCKSKIAEDDTILSDEDAIHFPYDKLCGESSYLKEACLPDPQGCGMDQSKNGGEDLRC
jgi:hypothetical protein